MRGAFPSGTEPGVADQPPRWTLPSPEQLQDHFPQLEIRELLGVGGMGAVYKALQKKLDRTIALKILATTDRKRPGVHRAVFTRGQGAGASESSQHCGDLRFRSNGPLLLFHHGNSWKGRICAILLLTKLWRRAKRCWSWSMQILRRSAPFAHDERIVHRDIKPENILISKKGQE